MGSQCGRSPHRPRAPARAPGAGRAARPRPGPVPVTASGPPSWPA